MVFLYGIHRFARRIVAFRNDYCMACRAPRVAFLHRSFNALHVFFIPLIPLGFWRSWRCGTCGLIDPHVGETRPGFKWAGIGLLLLFTSVAWITPPEAVDDPNIFLGFRIVVTLVFVFAVVKTLRSKPRQDLAERLRTVMPSTEPNCPICRISLTPGQPFWYCGVCGMERQALV